MSPSSDYYGVAVLLVNGRVSGLAMERKRGVRGLGARWWTLVGMSARWLVEEENY